VGRALRGLAIVVGVFVLGMGLLLFRATRPPDVPVTTVEVVPPDESNRILALVRKATDVIAHEPGADTLLRRDAHAKPHGCVRATLTVDDTIPATLRQGVFQSPGRVYQAWIRYSNGTMADDRERDARGMAIKLMGVEGPKLLTPEEDPEQHTQDFVMIDYPTFFLSTLEDYETFFDYQAAGRPVRWFFASANPLDWRLREFLIAFRNLGLKIASPLSTGYYSMSAYRFGPHNIKFAARPCTETDRRPPRGRGPNYLREALVADLAEGSGCFRFLVQRQDPTRLMPIEDASVEWDEEDAPYEAIATLDIPPQTFATPEQDAFCERLQFSPFHAVPDQRPLGRMNRVREMVYREVSKRRHAGNGVPIAEPRGWCLDLTGATCPAEEAATDADGAGDGAGGGA
jgi:catalase